MLGTVPGQKFVNFFVSYSVACSHYSSGEYEIIFHIAVLNILHVCEVV